MLPKDFQNTYSGLIHHWIESSPMDALLTIPTAYGAPVLPGWLTMCRLLAQPALAQSLAAQSGKQDPHHEWLLSLRRQLESDRVVLTDWFRAPSKVARRAVAMARQACGLLPAEEPPLLSPLERHLLSHALLNGSLTPADPGHLQMVVMLVDRQAGGNEAGRLAWLHLWRLDAHPALGERLARAPQAQALWVDADFEGAVSKVARLLESTIAPTAPALAWALQPLPLLRDDGRTFGWGLNELTGASLSVALAVGSLFLLRQHLLPAFGSGARLLARLQPQALAITAQLEGDTPPLPNPLQWSLDEVSGVGKKFHALLQHHLHPQASENRLPSVRKAWVAQRQRDCDGDGISVVRAHSLAHLLTQASQAHGEGLPEAAQALLEAVLSVQGDGVDELAARQPIDDLPQLPPLPAALVSAMRQAPREELQAHTLQALEQHLLRRLAQWTGGEHLQFQHDAGPVSITGAPVRLRDEFRAIAIDIPLRHPDAEAMRREGKTEAEIREAFSARTLQDLLANDRFGSPKAWVLSADPAAGKTTLLAEYELRTCWRALHRFARHSQWGEVALWVPMRQLEPLRAGEMRHATEVMDEWITSYAPAFGQRWQDLFDGPLAREHGMQVRPLFDGVNELKCSPDQRDRFLRQLMKTWWPDRSALRPTPVFTVRTLERSFSLDGEGRANLRPWDESRRNQYIDERLGEGIEAADALKEAIRQDPEPNDELKLYANPGMLALVCNLLRRGWISEPTANRAQLFACTLWMRLHDELHRTQDHPSESLEELLHPHRERQQLIRLAERMDQQLWVPPEQPGPLFTFLRDLARRMQWPVDGGAPMMEMSEDELLEDSAVSDRLLKAAEALHLLVKGERKHSTQRGAMVVVWRWAHQRWLEFWAAYGLTPDDPPADLTIPPGPDLERLYQDFLERQRSRPAVSGRDDGDRFTLPAAPLNTHEEVVAMAAHLRGRALEWVKLLLARGNPELAARVALENWAPFGERRDHPQDGWWPEGSEYDERERLVMTGDGEALAHRRTHRLLNQVRATLLARMNDPAVHISSRIRSGFLLGDLGGDGRFEICGEALILKDEHWQRVPAEGDTVSFQLGDLEGGSNQGNADSGVLQVDKLPAFEMAGLLTTQAQMRCFIYSITDQELPFLMRSDAEHVFLPSMLNVEKDIDQHWFPDGRGYPRIYWLSELPYGSLPFIGNFRYAQAYALWESAQRRATPANQGETNPGAPTSVQLPTEEQWASAVACGLPRSGRHWRFGHTEGLLTVAGEGFHDVKPWHFNHANVFGRTTPVGVFIDSAVGPEPESRDRKLRDMAGNVWQWTSSGCDARLRLSEVIIGFGGGNLRAVRGGSYNNSALVCSAAVSHGSPPDKHNLNVGFRLVRLVIAA